MAETIIKTENLSYVYSAGTPYEHRAIDNINIEIEKGSFVGLIGHTGSGKSTTLASIIHEINKRRHCHIFTIEDPIEYKHENIQAFVSQREVGEDTASFEEALRRVLREAPDVVLIGEMRDQETAEIAIRAAITGHLVLSTLHTNDAASTVVRLVDMGVATGIIVRSGAWFSYGDMKLGVRLMPMDVIDDEPFSEVLFEKPKFKEQFKEGESNG